MVYKGWKVNNSGNSGRGSSRAGSVPVRGNLAELVNEAVQDGVSELVTAHPGLSDKQDYIASHIDQRRVKEIVSNVYAHLTGQDLSDEERAMLLHQGIVEYVAQGEVLDDHARTVLLEKGLGERREAMHRFWTESDDIDQALDAFNDLYTLMKSGDYAKLMPEVAEDVATLYRLGFVKSAARVLYDKGVLAGRRYKIIEENIDREVRRARESTAKKFEDYTKPKEVRQAEHKRQYAAAAAILFGFGGLFMFLNSMQSFNAVTGNIVNNSDFVFASGLVGFIFVFISLCLTLYVSLSRKKVSRRKK